MRGQEGGTAVTAVMVTQAGRENLARMAVASFLAQTWPDKRLVILNTGRKPVVLQQDERITEFCRPQGNDKLSDLRNTSLELAPKDHWVIQWDDDDWSADWRIACQMKDARLDRCTLLRSQIRINVPKSEFVIWHWRLDRPPGIPGTILFHRSSGALYRPGLSRDEDSHLVADHFSGDRCHVVENFALPHTYLRLYHGGNTWDQDHFFGRHLPRPFGDLGVHEKYVRQVLSEHLRKEART